MRINVEYDVLFFFQYQVYEEYADKAESWLAGKEAFLNNDDLGVSLFFVVITGIILCLCQPSLIIVCFLSPIMDNSVLSDIFDNFVYRVSLDNFILIAIQLFAYFIHLHYHLKVD